MGTEGGRVRCRVVDKPMGYEGTEWAHKGGQKTLLSEESKDLMEARGTLSCLGRVECWYREHTKRCSPSQKDKHVK